MARNSEDKAGCLKFFIYLFIGSTLGAWTFDYALWFIFGANVPWWCDALCGIFTWSISIPVAIVCWFLSLGGIVPPLVN